MKRTRIAGITALSVLFGLGALAQPGHDRRRGRDDKNPGRHAEHYAQPEQHRPATRGPDHHESARYSPQKERSRHEAEEWQRHRGWSGGNSWQAHNRWNEMRVHNWEREHRTWAQRGGYGGYFIPRDRYVAHFGPQHWFRIHARPVFYMGYPRFAYGGFSFLMLDPWPDYWPENWYASDDVYVDYDDGYYLYNRRDPGVRIAVSVVF